MARLTHSGPETSEEIAMSLFDRIARLFGARGGKDTAQAPARPNRDSGSPAGPEPASASPGTATPTAAPSAAAPAPPEPSPAEATTATAAQSSSALPTTPAAAEPASASRMAAKPAPVAPRSLTGEAPSPAPAPVRTRRATLLVTGFGPFPGVSRNPSEALVKRIAAKRIPGVETRILPTEWATCDALPEVAGGARKVLMFGVAKGARRIRYERMSRPAAAPRPDAAGKGPGRAPTRTRRTRLDVADLVRAARRKGYPVAPSGNAGAYICNASYGAALARNPDTLFVHIPEPTRRGPLSLDGLEAHAEWLVTTLLAEKKPARVSSRRRRPRAAGRAHPRATAASSRESPREGRAAGRSGA